jgi:nucleotide-binding universal stress UspA family protein
LPESWRALRFAAELALGAGATMRVFSVDPGPSASAGMSAAVGVYAELAEAQREAVRSELRSALDELPQAVRAAGTLLAGDPATSLAAKAAEGVDLMVMGSRGYGPIGRVLLGSVSARLLRVAPCPVLVVPRAASVTALTAPIVKAVAS